MGKKDAVVIKVLADVGLSKDTQLSPEQEEILRRAIDPEEQFMYDIEQLFKITTEAK